MAELAGSESVAELLGEGPDLDEIDRRHLLAAALGQSLTWLYTHPEHRPAAEQTARYRSWLDRRRKGEPVAYLEGRRGFWTLELGVDPAVLIPRPETELLVELALASLAGRSSSRSSLMLADLGTGSGAIALAVAAERPDAELHAVDVSKDALVVARANAERLGLENVTFHEGCWFAPLAGLRFDIVVSNPPYLAEDDPHLEQGDLPAEPRTALVSGPSGLEALEAIIEAAPAHLHPGGTLLLEHGWTQQEAVMVRCRAAGFPRVRGHRDLAGHPRVVEASLDSKPGQFSGR